MQHALRKTGALVSFIYINLAAIKPQPKGSVRARRSKPPLSLKVASAAAFAPALRGTTLLLSKAYMVKLVTFD